MKTFSKARIAQKARVVLACALAGTFVAACKGSDDPGVLSTLVVSPNPATVAAGATVQFTAAGTDFTGAAVVPNAGVIVWSVVAGGGTINSSTGLFTAGTTPGTFTNTVVATCRGISATATVVVTPGPLATITVTPNPVTLAISTAQTFTAVGKDAFGNIVTINPTWTVTAGGGTIPAGTTGLTAPFTSGTVTGAFANTVRATQGTIFGTATVNVVAGPLATITVTPNPATLVISTQQTFTAVGTDAAGNVVTINPTWSVTAGGGTIPAGTTGLTALFTAGTTTGTFPNTVRATQGTIFGTATVIVVAGPPAVPPPALPATAATFRILANAAVTCTNGTITGDVGTFQASGGVPPGSITQSLCPITSGTAQVGTAASKQAYTDFVATYTALASTACGTVLTGTLAGVTLPPGVYCFDAAASLTGTLTLNGPSTGVWLFKVGTSGTGALTGTGFSVVLAGGATSCNVTWWVQQAATMTDSNFKGSILTGTVLVGSGVTLTRGTLQGNAWAQGDVTITGTAITPCGP